MRELGANLFRPLAGATLADLERGSELEPGRTRPARLAALWSSAALVANVFDYWRDRDNSPLVAALGLGGGAATLSFEEPLPTGLAGDPPLADVALRRPAGQLAVIESKFSEWLVRRPRHKAQFKAKYFPPGAGVWQGAGLPRCQALAADIQAGRQRFKYLQAPQLLKYALGLAVGGSRDATLAYLYYDWPGRAAEAHREEIEAFATRVGAELDFRALTYQSVYAALRAAADEPAYGAYLGQRYFA